MVSVVCRAIKVHPANSLKVIVTASIIPKTLLEDTVHPPVIPIWKNVEQQHVVKEFWQKDASLQGWRRNFHREHVMWYRPVGSIAVTLSSSCCYWGLNDPCCCMGTIVDEWVIPLFTTTDSQCFSVGHPPSKTALCQLPSTTWFLGPTWFSPQTASE